MRNDIFLKEIGMRIKVIRNSKKISLRKLGELCKLDYTNLSRIETGQKGCHLLTLKNVADNLNVDIKDFL